MCSSGVVGFSRARPGGRWVQQASLCSLVHAIGVDGFIQGRCVHLGVPLGSIGSSGVVAFTFVRPGVVGLFSGRLLF